MAAEMVAPAWMHAQASAEQCDSRSEKQRVVRLCVRAAEPVAEWRHRATTTAPVTGGRGESEGRPALRTTAMRSPGPQGIPLRGSAPS